MKKVSQEKIADQLGISQASLSRFLSGKSRSSKVCKKIADLIGGQWISYFLMPGEDIRGLLAEKVLEDEKREFENNQPARRGFTPFEEIKN